MHFESCHSTSTFPLAVSSHTLVGKIRSVFAYISLMPVGPLYRSLSLSLGQVHIITSGVDRRWKRVVTDAGGCMGLDDSQYLVSITYVYVCVHKPASIRPHSQAVALGCKESNSLSLP